MRAGFCFGRLCLRRGLHPPVALFRLERRFSIASKWRLPGRTPPRPPGTRKTLYALLSPAAFVQLSEEDSGDGKTPEEHMLEASRAEIEKTMPDNLHGFRRVWHGLYLFLDKFMYEPLATGFRFLHLVLIFVPVIAAVPMIWFGRRQKEHDLERTGTLLWYRFLVHSMERAGPAFIKVCITSIE